MKPVVVVTVHRRYHELASNLARLRELAGEFSEPPDVVVVWACPDVGHLWFFQRLRAEGLVHTLLTRPRLPGERADGPTTYPESHNIRLGLSWVRDHYDPASAYALVMAADVRPNERLALKFVDDHVAAGARAVVLFWPNGCVRSDIWHTNFFAVCLDERYWPPVLGEGDSDTLEWAWGKHLLRADLPGVVRGHNSRERRFAHRHESDAHPPWPVVPQAGDGAAPLLITGHLPWWRRALQRVGLLRPFRRPGE